MPKDGLRYERELSNILEDRYGFAAMPSGASGSGTDRPRPDVLACRGVDGHRDTDAYAIEVKAWKDATGSLTAEEVDALCRFAERAGATPMVVIRPDLRRFDQWHCYAPGRLNRTDAGNHSVRQADLPGDALWQVFGPERGDGE